mmetsp:Transcript_20294/g.29990  ORF Transcript_20294/g.29990 Transcript_20294/m.29990 type:complete len:254 (+) Transcript_20294:175-936(+)
MIQMSTEKSTSIALIVIGSEILSNQVKDFNSSWIIAELKKLNLEVNIMTILPDDTQQISKVVRSYSNEYDYVITTGGIGPTHDDVTIESIAIAFQSRLRLFDSLKEIICQKIDKHKISEKMILKLCSLPTETKLIGNGYPTLLVRNVCVLPGIPSLMKKQFQKFSKLYLKNISSEISHSKLFEIKIIEIDLLEILQELVLKHPTMKIGSYPADNETPETIIYLEAHDEHELIRAENDLKKHLKKCSVQISSKL